MRIAILTPGFSADESDWCIPALSNFVRVLAERNEVTVFSHSYPHANACYAVFGAEVHTFGDPGQSFPQRLLGCRAAILACHRDRPFDLIHSFFAGPTGALGAATAKRLNIASVATVMGGELVDLRRPRYGGNRGWPARLINRYVIEHTVRMTTLSDYGATLFGKPFTSLPFGVDIDRFTPHGPKVHLAGPMALLMVGSLQPIKGHALALAALRRLRERRKARLHIVGEGELEQALHAQARADGVSDAVEFHGAVAHHDLPAYYRAADALLVPSIFETQCMVALEAAACGCPVVGARVGIIPEIVEPALTFAVDDVAGLAATLGRMLETADFRRTEGAVVRQTVVARFALRDRVAQTEQWYRDLLTR